MKECHKCPLNGKGNEQCIQCCSEDVEQYNYKYSHYILDCYDAPEQPKQEPMKATPFTEETEDCLRKALYDIFDLSPLELLTLQGIMHNKTIQQIADELTALFQKNNKQQTRHHIFQLRKAIIGKMPNLKSALITMGQRKELKGKQFKTKGNSEA